MRRKTSRLLSGLMAAVMVCSLTAAMPAKNEVQAAVIDVYAEDFSTATESGWTSNWAVSADAVTDAIKESEWKLWTPSAQKGTFTKTFTGLEAGEYQFTCVAAAGEMGACTVKVGEASADVILNPWGETTPTIVTGVKLDAAGDLTVTYDFDFKDAGWVNLDDIKLQKTVDDSTMLKEMKKQLDASIAECEALSSSDYSSATWSALQDALKAAKTVSAKEDATEDEITNAKSALVKAKKALKEVNSIFVKKIDNLSEDFIRGIDISSYISVTDSGATFKDANGKVLNDQEFFKMLNDSGVNYARIRVWNDPYTADGKGYGGGNNDLAKAKIIGKLATDAGMKVLIDFHYSDWWADPERQLEPKAWKGMNVEQKATALYDYTKNSLNELLDAGVDVAMVQVGNETNNGIAGVDRLNGWGDMCKLFNAGSKAVREVAKEKGKEIQVALHFTDPQTKNWYNEAAKELDAHSVDYDVFASSYYPDIHGTMENMVDVLQKVATDYNKKVMVAETAWSWTTADGDGHSHTFNPGKSVDYAVSVQGQVNELRDVMDAVNSIKNNAGIGVFYWEPTWIPVQCAYDEDGKLVDSIYKSNKEKWEKYGSGWASSYSMEYDPEHGQYFGGSIKDDQAFFDFEGNPLASLTVFKDVYTGVSGSKVTLETVKNTSAEIKLESSTVASEMDKIKKVLPKTVTGVYNNSTKKELPVTWDNAQVEKINAFGNYTISGVATCDENKTESVTCSLTILPRSILKNGDFEEGNSNWKVANVGKAELKWDDTPLRGEGAMHFWSPDKMKFTLTQTVKADKTGKYCTSLQVQGGDDADKKNISIKVTNKTTGVSVSASTKLAGWCVWQNPVSKTLNANKGDQLQVVITVSCQAGAWGSIDDVFLYRTGASVADKKGAKFTIDNATYTVTKAGKTNGTVQLTGVTSKAGASVVVPATINAGGITYKVTGIAANALKGNKKVTSLTISSDKLTKAGVKNSLKGSSVKKVKVTGAAKKQFSNYKKYFAKGNSGKSVTVSK